MARLIGPDENSRLVYTAVGGNLRSAAGKSAIFYADSAATTLADIRTEGGAAVSGSTLTVDTYSKLPLFQFPDGVDVVYAVVNGGPVTPIYARADDRMDAVDARVTALEAGGAGDALVLHKAGVENVTGVKTFTVSPVVPAPSGGTDAAHKTYVDTGDAAVTAAAASDATTKANAAQAAAVQRANHTGTQTADTLTDGATNVAMLATERTKLAGVATGATANATDAQLRDRATHTGTQDVATVTGLGNSATRAVGTTVGTVLSPDAVDAKGDLLAGTGADTVARVPVGTNGQILVADSAQAAGVVWATRSPDVQTFNSSGSYVVPTGAKMVRWRLVGSTSGAGSGARGASGTALSGGAASGGAALSEGAAPATGALAPGSSITVTIGAPGVGGAAITTDNTAGNAGTAGGACTFGTFAITFAGTGGGGGQIAASSTAGSAGDGLFAGAAGAGAVATGAPQVTSQNSRGGGAGGGPGGGITTGAVASNGANGGSNLAVSAVFTREGGVVGGALPSQGGNSGVGTFASSGSGGGAASTTGAAQDGANSSLGGGAGGGGASLNGNNSGKGGDGAAGRLEVVATF